MLKLSCYDNDLHVMRYDKFDIILGYTINSWMSEMKIMMMFDEYIILWKPQWEL